MFNLQVADTPEYFANGVLVHNCDELAKWAQGPETWSNLEFGLRNQQDPRIVVTTTPRPVPLLRNLLSDPGTHVTRGSTFDNITNLPERYIARMRHKYEGTRLGRQELYAELLDDVPNALWTHAMIEQARIARKYRPDSFRRIVIGVDPSGRRGDEDEDDVTSSIGIVVVGLDDKDVCHVLADRTCQLSPAGWAKRVCSTYDEYAADLVVAEINYGGAMVEHVIRATDNGVAVKVVHASRGKHIRAQPVAALYEQGRVKHVGSFPELEEQMTSMDSMGNYALAGSPDRLDALVWAVTELCLGEAAMYDDQQTYMGI